MKEIVRWAVILVLGLVALAACTTYKPHGFGGGYTDFPMGQNKHRIEVRGNGYTSRERVQNMALVRAADIALQQGYEHFFVLDTQNDTKIRAANVHESGLVSTIDNDYVIMIIELTNDPDAVNARQILQQLGPQVGR